MKKILFPAALLLFVISSFAQSNIELGSKAPSITITNWVSNVPQNKDLKGKYIVLEFWATWCGPCIAAVPHMNTLQTQVESPDLIFLSITDESVNKVNRTLEKIDFKSAVVTDTTKQTQINFGDGKKGLEVYPLTVLIDNHGIVKWIGEPQLLTENNLKDFLADKLSGVNHFASQGMQEKTNEQEPSTSSIQKSVSIQEEFLSIVKDKDKLFFVELRNTNSTKSNSVRIGNKAILLSPVSLRELYSELFNVSLQPSLLVDSSKFTFIYKNMNGDALDIKDLEKYVLRSLAIERQKRIEESSKYEIAIRDESLLKPTMETMFSSKSNAGNETIFTNFSISEMADEMAAELNMNISYSGNNEVKCDFMLATNNLEEFTITLEEYGLAIQEVISKEEVIYLIEK